MRTEWYKSGCFRSRSDVKLCLRSGQQKRWLLKTIANTQKLSKEANLHWWVQACCITTTLLQDFLCRAQAFSEMQMYMKTSGTWEETCSSNPGQGLSPVGLLHVPVTLNTQSSLSLHLIFAVNLTRTSVWWKTRDWKPSRFRNHGFNPGRSRTLKARPKKL